MLTSRSGEEATRNSGEPIQFETSMKAMNSMATVRPTRRSA